MNLYDESMSPIWVDELSGMRTTSLRLPLEYLQVASRLVVWAEHAAREARFP